MVGNGSPPSLPEPASVLELPVDPAAALVAPLSLAASPDAAIDPDPPLGSVAPLDGCTVEPDEPLALVVPEELPVALEPFPPDVAPLVWVEPAVALDPEEVPELEAPVGEPQASRKTMGATDQSSLRTVGEVYVCKVPRSNGTRAFDNCSKATSPRELRGASFG
jgi:hypothetical protein